MSDEEEVMSGEEESEEEEESRPEDTGPSEAELAMQRRRQQQSTDYGNLDEEAQALLEANTVEREAMEQEIRELQERRERRKKEREQEERELAARRSEEEARRKKEEEERNSKKLAEEEEKRKARAAKMAEFEKWKNVSSPNFVITKKSGDAEEATEGEEGGEKKSKEQLEAEKRAILEQRIPKLDIAGADSGKLTEKAKELHALIMRLESEKYDLEKRFKTQQYDMMELAERARQMNKVGRGGLKRVKLTDDMQDLMQEKFAGCPSRILMFSPFERQKDMRSWRERRDVFTGPMYRLPEGRVEQRRILKFNEADGQPFYEYIPGMEPKDDEEE